MKHKAPALPTLARPQGYSGDLPPKALDRWNPQLRAATAAPADINVFDVIGADPWTGGGVTAAGVSARLKELGTAADVQVNINSPGGDVFEGLAIYNLLREHKGSVNVRVVGVAASSASIIAMAGDTVQIAQAGFLMIHNAWTFTGGNRNDLRGVADVLQQVDFAMAEVYAIRADVTPEEAAKLMDAETWLSGSEAVDKGFADSLLDSDAISSDTTPKSEAQAARKLDVLLAKAGVTRAERRKLLTEYKASTPRAADPEGTPSAADVLEVKALINSLKGILP